MECTIARDNLLTAVQTVHRAVSPHSPLPILSGILFETRSDELKLTATDMEISIQCTVPVTTLQPGAVVLPARYITELVKRLPDTGIKLQTDPATFATTVFYGASHLSINAFPPQEFPAFPAFPASFKQPVASLILKELLKRNLFALSTDESRPFFTGGLFELEAGELRVVTSDSHRLSLSHANLDVPSEEPLKVIIPGKTLHELMRLLGSTAGPVEMIVGDNQAAFYTPEWQLVSRLVAGQFPAYQQLIPNQFEAGVEADRHDLLDAAERAALFARDNFPIFKFSLFPSSLIISIHSEVGWIREEVAAAVEGQTMEIFFNVRYLIDVLRHLEASRIRLQLTGPLSPALITAPGVTNYLSLLVPSRMHRD